MNKFNRIPEKILPIMIRNNSQESSCKNPIPWKISQWQNSSHSRERSSRCCDRRRKELGPITRMFRTVTMRRRVSEESSSIVSFLNDGHLRERKSPKTSSSVRNEAIFHGCLCHGWMRNENADSCTFTHRGTELLRTSFMNPNFQVHSESVQ